MFQKNDTDRYNTRDESLFTQVWERARHQVGRSKAAIIAITLFLVIAFTFVLNGNRHQEVLATTMLPAKQVQTQANVPAQKAERTQPQRADGRVIGSGEASYYGDEFAGQETASGEHFNPAEMTAAHRTLPLGSRVRVTNEQNGRSVIVRVNDRGPYTKGRIMDVSEGAAQKLGMTDSGTAQVELEVLPKTSGRR